jgi:hypothetical protein
MVLSYLVFKKDPFAVKGGANPGPRHHKSCPFTGLQIPHTCCNVRVTWYTTRPFVGSPVRIDPQAHTGAPVVH